MHRSADLKKGDTLKMLLGIGNELNGDDGIGCFIARKFRQKDWLSFDCSTVPENYLGKVIENKPELLVIVDAAQMGLNAGEIRIIKKEDAASSFASTHTLALREFISAAEKYAKRILLIGIQPKQTGQFCGLSKEATKAMRKLIDILKEEKFEKLKKL